MSVRGLVAALSGVRRGWKHCNQGVSRACSLTSLFLSIIYLMNNIFPGFVGPQTSLFACLASGSASLSAWGISRSGCFLFFQNNEFK